MYHWRDGWYFQRFENGDVEIKRIPPGKQGSGFGEGEADLGITIPAEEWVSIVHVMLPPDTPAGAFYQVRAMHLGEPLQPVDEFVVMDDGRIVPKPEYDQRKADGTPAEARGVPQESDA